MNAVERHIRYSGGVPQALTTAFAQSEQFESDGPPTKRRKLASGPLSLRQVNGTSESGVPHGYIPLARFDLYLEFARRDSNTEEYLKNASNLPRRLPVFLESAETILSSSDCHPATQDSPPNDCFHLVISSLSDRRPIFEEKNTSEAIVELGKHLEYAHRLTCADRYNRKAPITCYQCTLHRSPDGMTFRLETIILWKDSLDIINEKLLHRSASEIFARYVLQSDMDESGHAANWHKKQRGMGYSSKAMWSPRDFYDNVHVPQDTPSSSAEIKCDLIHCQLYPFQRRAIRWLIQREGSELQTNGQVLPIEDKSSGQLPPSFQQFTDAEGKAYFASSLFMTVASDLSNWHAPADDLKGGILAEEMGLGKTVEMISLMCLHRRIVQPDSDIDNEGRRISGATLIITPPAILQQWIQEIQLHAPALHVLHYTGISRHQKLSDRELVELLADQDVVLTTYDVLAREIHYSGNAPERNLRHEKRFEPRKTPLVRISWWRVCLDEAQMIESGVSNAAKVARLIPRRNAWAVTGTPLRKDISDLLGLLLFLQYEPYSGFVWNRLCTLFKPVLSGIINRIALRHSKDRVRNELNLPSQKRFVITIPFNAVEEQHYGQLFEQMTEDCGLDPSGAPMADDWNPEDPAVVEKMRSWLMRLRQACLYPAGSNRRTVGMGGGPLRPVTEALELMIDQNDALIHAEERALVLSQLRRGQLLENALLRQRALDLWTKSYERSTELVKEYRTRLEAERAKSRAISISMNRDSTADDTSDNEGEEVDKNPRVGAYRQRLRAALEIQHIAIFFIGNAFYQIRTDAKLTVPDSEEFKALEKRETEAYEEAKLIRQEILTDISRKVDRYMKAIKEKTEKNQFVVIPKMAPELYYKGLESRRIFDKFEEFCKVMNEHAAQYNKWRDTMIKLLSQSLIDQEGESELEGNEYERSTKHQDEMYVYMEALRAMFADRHDALTGQQNVLIAHEVKTGIIQAQRGEGPSPDLFLSIMNTRSALKPDPGLGSLRGIISELRSLATSLEWQGSGGSSRALAELELVNSVLHHAGRMATEQTKVSSGLEREVEMFRDTMNNRLEYYRQLQQISDTVAPYDEESVGKPLDENLFAAKLKQENDIDAKISTHRSKHRYLLHLRDESGADPSARICVICQSSFEIGVLTVCGHKYCKDCLRLWWNQHRTCPTCKKRLKINDFHQITYKPEEFVVQEEKSPAKLEAGRSSNNFIYADISSGTLKEIKNIDLDDSFGTKIDTLARHILWLREHDPGAKSIIFSQYKTFLEVLGTAFARLKIGYSSIDNADGIERFKSDPAIECFFLHAKAQSSGLNLVNATHVFLCEPLVNTAIELQAIARVHRIGQHRPTTVWMYLVSDTVEQSIYDLSVSRRLAHIFQKEKTEAQNTSGRVIEGLTETAIDAANSLEVQDATLAMLMTKGSSGGELVKKDDLWQCLFGSATRKIDLGAEQEVARFLRGDAAENRRSAAAA